MDKRNQPGREEDLPFESFSDTPPDEAQAGATQAQDAPAQEGPVRGAFEKKADKMAQAAPQQTSLPSILSPGQLARIGELTMKTVDAFVDKVQAQVEFWNRVQPLAIKQTNARDWCLMGDNPYLMSSGVSKILRLIGAEILLDGIATEWITSDNGRRDAFYTATGKIIFGGKEFPDVGCSSTRDELFAERTHRDGPQAGQKYLLPPDEIDLEDVKKKALTNLHHRLLSRVFPLNPSIDELKALGIEPTAQVKFGRGSKGGSTDTKEMKNQRVELANTLNQLAGNLGISVADALKKVSAFSDFAGYTDIQRVSEKALPKCLDKAKTMLNDSRKT